MPLYLKGNFDCMRVKKILANQYRSQKCSINRNCFERVDHNHFCVEYFYGPVNQLGDILIDIPAIAYYLHNFGYNGFICWRHLLFAAVNRGFIFSP